jgi:hypothetical protein
MERQSRTELSPATTCAGERRRLRPVPVGAARPAPRPHTFALPVVRELPRAALASAGSTAW